MQKVILVAFIAFAVFGQTVDATSLATLDVVPVSLVKGAVGNVKITVQPSTSVAIGATDTITIDFHDDYTLSQSTDVCRLDTCLGATLDGMASATVAVDTEANTVAVTRVSGTSSNNGAGAKTFYITNVQNPTGSSFSASAIVTTTDADTANTASTGTLHDAPQLYSIKKSCRAGNDGDGIPTTCTTSQGVSGVTDHSCLTCTSSKAFAEEYVEFCDPSPRQRCDARQSSYDSVSIYVNPHATGSLYCAAFTESFAYQTALPAYNIDSLTVGTTYNGGVLTSKARTVVNDDTQDQVLTIGGLAPESHYQVFCHMEDKKYSQVLFVHTLDNLNVWDVSFTAKTLTASSSPERMVLTFTHGSSLGNSKTITLTSKGSAAIFSTSASQDLGCTATSAGAAMTLTSAQTSGTTGKILLITLHSGATSAAGSKVVITCVNAAKMAANTAQANYFDLVVGSSPDTHKTVSEFYGYTPA